MINIGRQLGHLRRQRQTEDLRVERGARRDDRDNASKSTTANATVAPRGLSPRTRRGRPELTTRSSERTVASGPVSSNATIAGQRRHARPNAMKRKSMSADATRSSPNERPARAGPTDGKCGISASPSARKIGGMRATSDTEDRGEDERGGVPAGEPERLERPGRRRLLELSARLVGERAEREGHDHEQCRPGAEREQEAHDRVEPGSGGNEGRERDRRAEREQRDREPRRLEAQREGPPEVGALDAPGLRERDGGTRGLERRPARPRDERCLHLLLDRGRLRLDGRPSSTASAKSWTSWRGQPLVHALLPDLRLRRNAGRDPLEDARLRERPDLLPARGKEPFLPLDHSRRDRSEPFPWFEATEKRRPLHHRLSAAGTTSRSFRGFL